VIILFILVKMSDLKHGYEFKHDLNRDEHSKFLESSESSWT